MASSPTRKHFDVSDRLPHCSSAKLGYGTRDDALDAAEEMMRRDMVKRGCHITPYLCECGWWHVFNRLIVGHGWKRRV